MIDGIEMGGGIEPDVTIDGALRAHDTVDEGDERGADLAIAGGALAGEDRDGSTMASRG